MGRQNLEKVFSHPALEGISIQLDKSMCASPSLSTEADADGYITSEDTDHDRIMEELYEDGSAMVTYICCSSRTAIKLTYVLSIFGYNVDWHPNKTPVITTDITLEDIPNDFRTEWTNKRISKDENPMELIDLIVPRHYGTLGILPPTLPPVGGESSTDIADKYSNGDESSTDSSSDTNYNDNDDSSSSDTNSNLICVIDDESRNSEDEDDTSETAMTNDISENSSETKIQNNDDESQNNDGSSDDKDSIDYDNITCAPDCDCYNCEAEREENLTQ